MTNGVTVLVTNAVTGPMPNPLTESDTYRGGSPLPSCWIWVLPLLMPVLVLILGPVPETEALVRVLVPVVVLILVPVPETETLVQALVPVLTMKEALCPAAGTHLGVDNATGQTHSSGPVRSVGRQTHKELPKLALVLYLHHAKRVQFDLVKAHVIASRHHTVRAGMCSLGMSFMAQYRHAAS